MACKPPWLITHRGTGGGEGACGRVAALLPLPLQQADIRTSLHDIRDQPDGRSGSRHRVPACLRVCPPHTLTELFLLTQLSRGTRTTSGPTPLPACQPTRLADRERSAACHRLSRFPAYWIAQPPPPTLVSAAAIGPSPSCPSLFTSLPPTNPRPNFSSPILLSTQVLGRPRPKQIYSPGQPSRGKHRWPDLPLGARFSHLLRFVPERASLSRSERDQQHATAAILSQRACLRNRLPLRSSPLRRWGMCVAHAWGVRPGMHMHTFMC